MGEQGEKDVVISRLRSEKEGVVLVSVSHVPDEKLYGRPELHQLLVESGMCSKGGLVTAGKWRCGLMLQ